jgi:UDP-N-acetylmuramoyl-L-alanyl-D-glutamate--2,6-diaminopimelate ligase
MTDTRLLIDVLARHELLVERPPDLPVLTGITADSRSVVPGSAYVAIRGSQADGHQFIGDAVARGAALVVTEQPGDFGVPQVVVNNGRLAAVALAQAWYGDPGRSLALIGVTGTNGKTTTVSLVRHLMNEQGSAGSIGTLGAFDGHGESVPSTAGSLTTPGPVDMQATLAALRDRGCRTVAMETSSHSLHQGRLDGLSFRAGIFTNLTRDHLDYHGTMESYLASKLRLATLLSNDGVAVINAEDPAWRSMRRDVRRITFGRHAAGDVHATGISLDAAGCRFRLEGVFGSADIALPLLGDFNLSNGLGAAACARALGVPMKTVADRLNTAPQVPGRMERLAESPYVVLRDYAHTPDSLERALAALRPLTSGRLIVVFGCGGDRDKGKRPIMGRIAAEQSDLPIVTSDNPRTEDPDAIIDDIVAGMGTTPRRRIADRREAIRQALDAARPGDTVLLAGKGHETYQVVGTEKLPLDEREIVRELTGA